MTRMPPRLGIVFDLDDTLYLERDYAFSGFSALDRWLQQTRGIGGFADCARNAFTDGHRSHVFDHALATMGIEPTPRLIDEMVQLYRTHLPDLRLADDVASFFERWPADQPLALLTDGFHETQRNKVVALGLEESRLNPIVYTDAWGAEYWKPHSRGFEFIADVFDLPPSAMAYVADNPAKDFVAPRALGWRAIQIARPGGVHVHREAAPLGRPDGVIETLDDLEFALSLPS